MKNSKCWNVNPEASLDDILSWCISRRQVDRLIVIERFSIGQQGTRIRTPGVESTVASIVGSSLIRTEHVTAWPGTVITEGWGKLYLIEFGSSTKERMVQLQNRLLDWRPRNLSPLPEDICVYRVGDPLPTLVSVTHEGDAWLLHDGDLDAKLALPTDGADVLEFIPPPPHFYVPASKTPTDDVHDRDFDEKE